MFVHAIKNLSRRQLGLGNKLLTMSQCDDVSSDIIRETQRLLRAVPDAIGDDSVDFQIEIRDQWVADYMDGKIPEDSIEPNRKGFFRSWSVSVYGSSSGESTIEIFSLFNDHPRQDCIEESAEEISMHLTAGQSTANWYENDYSRWIQETANIEQFIQPGRLVEINTFSLRAYRIEEEQLQGKSKV